MHLQENTFLDIGKYPLHHMTYAPAKFDGAMSSRLGDGRCIYMKIHYLPSRSHEML